ncbi:MAG: FISUMP domain-containing protein [Crocinitomicaceae bacterium]
MKRILIISTILISFSFYAQQTGEFVDKRDGKTYKTVVIGSQTWMAENLNVEKFQNGDPTPEAKTAEEWTAAACEFKTN